MKNVCKLVECERELCRLRLRRAEMAAEMNKNMRSAEGEEKEQQTGRAKKPPRQTFYRLLILRGSRATDEKFEARWTRE